MRLQAESVLTQLGLRKRHLVALTVLRDRGGSTPQALSSTRMMDGTKVVGLPNELEAEQLIERQRSPQERRRHIVELTAAGTERLASAERALAAAENEMLGALDDAQRAARYSLLQQAANGEPPNCPRPLSDYQASSCGSGTHAWLGSSTSATAIAAKLQPTQHANPYSHAAGMSKPDPRIYALVRARPDVRPEEAVLLDDADPCVVGARDAGPHAIHYQDTAQAIEEIEGLFTKSPTAHHPKDRAFGRARDP
jgi:DNA-binding MarR family transcriptional regulator